MKPQIVRIKQIRISKDKPQGALNTLKILK